MTNDGAYTKDISKAYLFVRASDGNAWNDEETIPVEVTQTIKIIKRKKNA